MYIAVLGFCRGFLGITWHVGGASEMSLKEVIERERRVRERIDENGDKWIKKYFGGGPHFRNWLEQYREVYGGSNVEVEEIDSRGFKCLEEGNEKMYRIWVREEKI